MRGLDHEAIESLKADRVLQDAELGHTVSFRHDIYFEWAFVHDLIDHVEKLGAPSARKYSDTMEAKNRLAHVLSAPLQIIADKANALKTHELAKDGALSVNRFMNDMSYAGKWA